jgi:hypothetical protein
MYITACRKKQPQMTELNTNCDCASEVSAEFLMEEFMTSTSELLSETDTMNRGNNILFTAMDSTADYIWYIGSEVIDEKTFTRSFDASLIGQTLPMHLVVKRTPNNICFPNDDGYDSITKYLTVIDPGNQYVDSTYRIEGVFRMKDASMADSVDITLDMDNSYVYPETGVNWGPVFVFKNMDGQGLEIPFRERGNTYRQVWFKANGLGFSSDCYVRFIKSPSRIEMKFGAFEGYPAYHFFGRKIN